ncbi:hypothetical protein TrCOL_g6623 [Triparma columacea]|uniref:Uncharacterized protein n=1 Tax=Triparma columacea TaxID=722753 RepID=A0A9W7G1L5_9STRA|nr:hypothetical protein TrCOL_g6623 [Triparma columacea]
MGCLSAFNPLTWGDALRPAPKIDDEKRKSRAFLFIAALLIIVSLITCAFVYYLQNPGTKTTTVKNLTVEKAQDLFDKENEGTIMQLDCKCAKSFTENHPGLVDVYGSSCLEEAPIYNRCIKSIPSAANAYLAANCQINSCDCEINQNFAVAMCRSFVKVLSANYNAEKMRVSSLISKEMFSENAIETYTDMCMANLELQLDTIEVMGYGLNELRFSDTSLEPDIENYAKIAQEKYANFVEDNEEIICPSWSYNDATDEESHPLFDSSVEQTNLDLQWDNSANIINTALGGDEAKKGHYQSCNPTQCEFVEDESINDIALKVLALASPIFSTVMSCFIVVYGFLDNHWSDREHEMIDTLGKKSLTNNPVIGDNSL